MKIPKHCPGCGVEFSGKVSLVDGAEIGRVEMAITEDVVDRQPFDGGWDCYCIVCGWSGDVLPDASE